VSSTFSTSSSTFSASKLNSFRASALQVSSVAGVGKPDLGRYVNRDYLSRMATSTSVGNGPFAVRYDKTDQGWTQLHRSVVLAIKPLAAKRVWRVNGRISAPVTFTA